MSEDEKLKSLLAASNYRAAFLNRQEHLQLQFLTSLKTFWKGHTFKCDPQLITLINLHLEGQGRQQWAIIIDDNTLPVIIRDLKEFRDHVFGVYNDALTTYWNEYEKLKTARTTKEVIEAS